jgi:integrase
VHYRLKEILDRTERKSPLIALTSRGLAWSQSGFRASFFKLIRKLTSQGQIGEGLTFHGLRHTVATALAEVGCDPRTISSVLGQRSEAAAKLYIEEEDRSRRAAAGIRKLEKRSKNSLRTDTV